MATQFKNQFESNFKNQFSSNFQSSFGQPRTQEVDIIDQLEAYAAILPKSAQKKFAKEQDKENKPTLFQKVVSILSTGETGQAAYDLLDGKNPLASYGKSVIDGISGQGYDKKTYADVLEKLGMKRGALSSLMPWLYSETGAGLKFKKGGFADPTLRGTMGLALDILADPTTYLGGYGLVRRASGGGLKGLTEAGENVAKGFGKKYYNLAKAATTIDDMDKIWSEGAEALAKKFKSNPDKYFSGITFMGKEIIPRKVALTPGRYADKLMQHIPILNSVWRGAQEGVQDAFKYGADILKQGKKLGSAGEETAERYIKMKTKFRREADFALDNFYKNVKSPAKDFWNATTKADREAARRYITDSIEDAFGQFGIKAKNIDNATADGIIRSLKQFNEEILTNQNLSREGLDKSLMEQLSNYLPHIHTPEAKKALAKINVAKYKGGNIADYFINPDKSRTLWHYVAEDGSRTSGNASVIGLQAYDKAAEEAFLTKHFNKLVKTQDNHLRALATKMNQVDRKKLENILKTAPSDMFPTKDIQKKLDKLGRLSSKYEGKTGRIAEELSNIKNSLAEAIDELPDAGRYWKDKSGKIFTKERAMSIGEINDSEWAKKIMKEAGFENKTLFETDPFAITLARGQKAIKEIEKNNLLRSVIEQFGKQSDDFLAVSKRNPLTRKTSLSTKQFDVLEDGIRYIDPKIKGIPDGILLPDFIVGDLKKVTQMAMDDNVTNKILKIYDKTLNIWKSSVYGWFPASHGRNYIGGAFMNTWANPKWFDYADVAVKIQKGSDEVAELGSKSLYKGLTYKEIKEQLGKRGIFSQTGSLDIADINKSFNKNFFDKVQAMPIKAGEFVELNLRAPLFMAELANGKTMDQAISTVYRMHFDYAPLAATDFEKNVLKRLIPFYTWTRNMIPLLIEETIASPGKMSSFYKGLRNADDGSGEIDRTLLPSYMEEAGTIVSGDSALSGLGLPPNEVLQFLDPERWGKKIAGMLSPALKIPVELLTKYNTFRDKAIMDDNSGEFARDYAGPVKEWLEWEDVSFISKDGKEIKYSRVNPMRKYWLYALPTGRFSTLITRIYGEKEQTKITNLMTGISNVRLDLDQLKEAKQKEYEEKMLEIFINAGVFSQYGTAYKSSKEKLRQEQSN